jgi:hypothetical protein
MTLSNKSSDIKNGALLVEDFLTLKVRSVVKKNNSVFLLNQVKKGKKSVF